GGREPPPWKVNVPIARVRKELHRRSPRTGAAALAARDYVGPGLELMEWQGTGGDDDVHDDQQARRCRRKGRPRTPFGPLQPSSNVKYGDVTVWEGGIARVYDPRSKALVQAWLRQIARVGLYLNHTYIRLSWDQGRTWGPPRMLRYEPGEEF